MISTTGNQAKNAKCYLPDRELNPGLPRDRRGYWPLYYRGSALEAGRNFEITKKSGTNFNRTRKEQWNTPLFYPYGSRQPSPQGEQLFSRQSSTAWQHQWPTSTASPTHGLLLRGVLSLVAHIWTKQAPITELFEIFAIYFGKRKKRKDLLPILDLKLLQRCLVGRLCRVWVTKAGHHVVERLRRCVLSSCACHQ